jgi:hypothetical protein
VKCPHYAAIAASRRAAGKATIMMRPRKNVATSQRFEIITWFATICGAIAAAGNGFLCLACFERRLGRLLVVADFTPCPISIPAIEYVAERNGEPLPWE